MVILEIIEINKDMIKIYRKFLDSENKFGIIEGDGEEYVSKNKDKYDIIILDAYYSSAIPTKFLEDKFVEEAYRALKKSGILAVNCIGTMRDDGSLIAYANKLKRIFRVYKIDTAVTSNALLLCLKSIGKDEILKQVRENMANSSENRFLVDGYTSMSQI